jgi:ATP-dependent phosphofructokinase / diphosphate-dependent phosphofructokinase
MSAAGGKRIGILTGGGDVPGLNAAIKAFVGRMDEAGCEVLGLRRGYASLLHLDPARGADDAEWVKPLTRASTRTIDRSGGTVLHTSRINPALVKTAAVPERLRERAGPPDSHGRHDLTAIALEAVDRLGLDLLVAVGGDGTLSFARRLHDEGVAVIGIPKTMDNDVAGTDYCIGFSTAVTRSVHFVNDLRTTAGSHERFLVVELFGRYSGETCLLTSYLAATDRAVIAEVPFEPTRLIELLAGDRAANPSSYAVVAISEGARPVGQGTFESGEADAVGQRKLGGVGAHLRDLLQERTGIGVIYQQLGYLMRSGAPDSLDLLVAKNFGGLAADLALAGETGRLVAIVGGRYTNVGIEAVGAGARQVDVERFYDRDRYRPKVVGVGGLPMFLH